MKIKNSEIDLSRFSIFLILVFFIIVSSMLNPNFLSSGNILNILKLLAVPVLLSFGAMMLVISGMIDLSAGSVLALAGVLSVTSYKATGSLPLAVAVGIGTGMVVNLINALMVVEFKVPAFIATLAMQMVARGAALYYTDGQNILQIGGYEAFGQGTVGPIPYR
ncbi:MAG: ABC transporter permease [Sphaerochaetaceae bacterium]